MLIGNYSVLQKSPSRFIAGSTVSVEGQVRSNFGKSGANRNRFFPDRASASLPKYAVPTGYNPPYTWIIPQVAGELGSTGQIFGSGGVSSANAAGGVNGSATLSGVGSITTAIGQLVISMVATLAGAGTVAEADMRGYLNAVATLTGSGSLSGPIAALAWAVAAINGGGSISSATPYATGTLLATIRGYSDLTPEGIRDKVWDASLSDYQKTGSAGKALASAGAGGVDYNALASAVWANATRNLTAGSQPADIAAAVRTELAVELARIDAHISSISAGSGMTVGQFLALKDA